MAELQEKFNKIISEIEGKIQNKEELDFITEKISEVSTLFLDQLDKVIDLNTARMDEIAENQAILNNKIANIEKVMHNIEKDIYMDESYDFEIICPYCNNEFVTDFSEEVKEEVECPECHNIIELDWNQEEHEHSCGGHCGCCDSGCGHEEENNEDDEDM